MPTAPRFRSLPRQHSFEPLETRELLTGLVPTNAETYMLALINRARANPAAEAAREGIDLNEGLAAGTISTVAEPPLAMDINLNRSALSHSDWMLANNLFQHGETMGTTDFTGVDPAARMGVVGFSAAVTTGENIAYQATTGTVDVTAFTLAEYNDLFIDAGEPGRGHRLNILNGSFREMGAGIDTGPFTTQGITYNAVMQTNDFASLGGSTYFLTGIAYDDSKVTHNNFYDPGEGLGNITITATRVSDHAVFSTTTWASGGYSLALTPAVYNITATGTGLPGTFIDNGVIIGNANVEVDVTPAAVAPKTTVLGNAIAIANGDTTIASADGTDFGLVVKKQAAILHTFVIRNDGSGTLNLTSLVLPTGFTSNAITGVTLTTGQTFNLTLQLTTAVSGAKSGTVSLGTNDPASPFRFNISGFVGDSFVVNLYKDILNRAVDNAGLMYWTNQLVVGGQSSQSIASGIVNSTERRTIVIQGLYQSILGRAADSGGLTYWLNFFATGGTVETMQSGFYGSQEYFDQHGDNIDTTVNAYYVAFLGRNADSGGVAFWHGQISGGQMTRAQVSLAVLKSLEGRQRVVTRLYQTFLLRSPDTDGLNYWAAQLGTGASEVDITVIFLGTPEYFNR